MHNIDQTIHYVFGPLADGEPNIALLLAEYQKREISLEQFKPKLKGHDHNGVQDQLSVHTNDAASCFNYKNLKVVVRDNG
jgi:hypothetical protein